MASEVKKTIGAAGDYTDFLSWYADRKGDIVTRDTIEVAEILGEAVVGPVQMDGGASTVDSSHYFVIRATTGAEFRGDFGDLSGKSVINGNSAYSNTVSTGLQYTKFQNFVIKHLSVAYSNRSALYFRYIDYVTVSGVGITDIYSDDDYNLTVMGIESDTSQHNNYIYNCFVNNISSYMSGTGSKSPIARGISGNNVINCTVMNISATTNSSSGTPQSEGIFGDKIYNCVVGNVTVNRGNTKDFYWSESTNNFDDDYNASEDGTGDDVGTHGIVGITPADIFVDTSTATADCHQLEDAVTIDAGLDESAIFTTDIDGDTRPTGAGTWDIGADEYIVESQDYTKEDVASLPANDTNLSGAFTAQNYTDVSSDNNAYVDQTSIGQYAMFLYKDKGTAQHNFTVTWKGKSDYAPSSSVVKLQIYDRDGTTWEDLDDDNATGAGTEFTLTATVTSDLDHYYDANYWIACRVYQRAI